MISIIIPCYNAEAYLEECFKSIKAQTYKELEVIFIDDGSSDSSWALLEGIRQDNPEMAITLYRNKQNQGVSVARNIGIRAASGDYMTFVDADDHLAPQFLERLLQGKKRGDMSVVGIGGAGFGKGSDPFQGLITKERFVYEFWLTKHLFGSCNNKLYSRKLILRHDIFFDPSLKIMEDMFFNMLYCQYIDTIYVSEQKLYYYRRNEASVMHQKFSENNMTVIKTFHKLLALPFTEAEQKIIELHQVNSLLWLLRLLYKADDKEATKQYEEVILQELATANTRLFFKSGWQKGFSRYVTFLLYQLHPKCYKKVITTYYKFKKRR